MTKLMKRLALCLAMTTAFALALVLCGTALAAECRDEKRTVRDTDSAVYYELEVPDSPALLAEPLSGTWEGDEWYDEETDEWKRRSGTWTLDAAGTLTVEGTGEPPWDLYRQWDPDSIRRVVFGAGITRVSSEWFSSWCGESRGKNLTEVVLPDTVTAVENHAFYGCTSLASVTLGKGLTVIGSGAFQGTGLTSLTLPAGLTEIGKSAFAQCDQLDSIAVDKGNTAFKAVDGVVFSADGKTLELYPSGRRGACTVPAGTERIGDSAFTGARGLTGVTLPAGMAEIGNSAFEGCDGLKEIVFGAASRWKSRVFRLLRPGGGNVPRWAGEHRGRSVFLVPSFKKGRASR